MYQTLFRPLLFALDPELAHELMQTTLVTCAQQPGLLQALTSPWRVIPDKRLMQTLLGRDFLWPLGLAAGFDKHVTLWPTFEQLGVGFVELGSVSAQPWSGNPKPRVFRLPEDQALINRMGLNNEGVAVLRARIVKASGSVMPIGISVVKTPNPNLSWEAGLGDFAVSLQSVHGLWAYVCLNLSCPNTAEGKTFESPDALDELLGFLRKAEATSFESSATSARPWLIKLSPTNDTVFLDDMLTVGARHQIAGWVVSNTRSDREGLTTSPSRLAEIGRGGLSGRPLDSISNQMLAHLYRRIHQQQLNMTLIGVGGVHDAESAWQKIIHGASLVQVYTGLIYEGPGLFKRIHNGLLKKLDEYELPTIQDAVGLALKE